MGFGVARRMHRVQHGGNSSSEGWGHYVEGWSGGWGGGMQHMKGQEHRHLVKACMSVKAALMSDLGQT